MKVTIYTRIICMGLMAMVLQHCGNGKSGDKMQQEETGNKKETAIDLDTRLKTTDSLVVVFYKDPYGNDSLRYTRYYTQASVTAINDIQILQQQLTQPVTRLEKRRPCRSEGKIWCFEKGKVFQTLYFSTLCGDCCYVYLIKDGNFFYGSIIPSMTDWLARLKPLSIELENEGAADK